MSKKIKKKTKEVSICHVVIPRRRNMKHKTFTPIISSASGEVDCPKGWGKVKFSNSGFCPISGAQFCKDCEYKEKPEPDIGVGTVIR